MSSWEPRTEIMIKLCECILQSRVEVEERQLSCFKEFMKKNRNLREREYRGSPFNMLEGVLLKEKGIVRSLLPLDTHTYSVLIKLYVEWGQDERICAEVWVLTLKSDIHNGESNENLFSTISLILEELVFALTHQPIFGKFVSHPKLSSKYRICYELETNINNLENNLKEHQEVNISNFEHFISKQRTFEGFKIIINSYSTNFFTSNIHKRTKTEAENNKEIKLKASYSTEEKPTASENDEFSDLIFSRPTNRKLSVYELYDDELDCVIVSQSEVCFSASPKELVKEIVLGIAPSDDDFEMLEVSRDEQFVNDNKSLLKKLALYEI